MICFLKVSSSRHCYRDVITETKRNLKASEIYFYRRMLRVSYVDRVTNKEVHRQVGNRRELMSEDSNLNFLKKEVLNTYASVERSWEDVQGSARVIRISAISTSTHPACGDYQEAEKNGTKKVVKHQINDGTGRSF